MCPADSYYFDPALNINVNISEIETPILRSLEKLLEDDLGITLISDLSKISECEASIIRLDSDPLKRCAILYHSEDHGVDIMGCSQNSNYTLCNDAHNISMFNVDKSDILKLIIEYTDLKRNGESSDSIKRKLKYYSLDKPPLKGSTSKKTGLLTMVKKKFNAVTEEMGELRLDGT